ncbi:hypothetical protein ABER61_16090 [Brevibacillus formosus]|uniref:Tail fiber protein n=1 Tax=Brevibacillus formosus TaxID=54913 RepID=A0ABQ0T7U7_9BACL|nr:hypothetical protein [Brevibacillus formosus]MED1958060.1 hypothetical protein [Brevibacillus formosus]PSJ89223.1 hypothetical protein C7R91_27655 [Brevibacillus formosus]GED59382.1 hypothetical protein BFO01nite_35140 [Brevibacillus formosus]
MISDILRDHGMGKGINGADKKALIDIVNAADTNQSTVKTNIVNALNAVSTEKSLGLTAASTWVAIQQAIPQVKTGKKIATGTISSLSAQATTSVPLDFVPAIVMVEFLGQLSNGVDVNYHSINFLRTMIDGSLQWVSDRTDGVYVKDRPVSNGFVLTNGSYSGYTYKNIIWKAYE